MSRELTLAKLGEGKTKQIFDLPTVLIRSKDDITAGDGERRNVLTNKAILATETTCNLFELLRQHGIATHYIGRYDEHSFVAEKLAMIPLECVARRIAYGSYLKRNPGSEALTRFDDVVLELFLKDDRRHDPFVYWRTGRGYELHDAKRPFDASLQSKSAIGAWYDAKQYIRGDMRTFELKDVLLGQTRQVFLALEKALSTLGVTLVDLKIEFGWTDDGRLLVGDVIDADSWRAWVGGDPSQGLDKQYYRDLAVVTEEAMAAVGVKYAQTAAMTARLLNEPGK